MEFWNEISIGKLWIYVWKALAQVLFILFQSFKNPEEFAKNFSYIFCNFFIECENLCPIQYRRFPISKKMQLKRWNLKPVTSVPILSWIVSGIYYGGVVA